LLSVALRPSWWILLKIPALRIFDRIAYGFRKDL